MITQKVVSYKGPHLFVLYGSRCVYNAIFLIIASQVFSIMTAIQLTEKEASLKMMDITGE